MNGEVQNINGVIYCTTNLINGMKYIGYDSHNNLEYLGSGKIFKYALEKYGKKKFKKQILQNCSSVEQLLEAEIYWINYFNAQYSNLFYNITLGGVWGDTFTNHPNKENIRKKLSGRIPWNKNKTKETDIRLKLAGEKLSKQRSGRTLTIEHRKNIGIGINNSEKFQKAVHSKEFANKCSTNTQNRIYGPAWNKNLTTETDVRVKNYGETISKKKKVQYASGEIVSNFINYHKKNIHNAK